MGGDQIKDDGLTGCGCLSEKMSDAIKMKSGLNQIQPQSKWSPSGTEMMLDKKGSVDFRENERDRLPLGCQFAVMSVEKDAKKARDREERKDKKGTVYSVRDAWVLRTWSSLLPTWEMTLKCSHPLTKVPTLWEKKFLQETRRTGKRGRIVW